MPKGAGARTGMISAAIFIVLEFAAIVMLKNSSTLQNIWLNRISHRSLGVLWGWTESVRGHFMTARENERLAEENFYLSEELRKYREAVEAMNEEASVASDVETPVKGRRRFQYIPATVVKISRNTSHNYIILNKGLEDGVKPHSGIITNKGIVGIVGAVDKHYSYGLTLMNAKISVSSRIGSTGYIAPLVWDGKHTDGAYLRDLSPHYIIPQMDTVYTSGFSSIFPAGIPIGTTGSTSVVDGATCQTEVTLFQDFLALHYVTIVENPQRSEIYNLERKNEEEVEK